MNFANFVDFAAREVPVSPALSDATELISYSKLSEMTDAAANALCSLGVGPNDRVAICLQNRLEFLSIHLGAMKRGAVPVPINTQFNDEQIRHVLTTSDISVIVTNRRFEAVATSVETAITTDGSVGYNYHTLLAEAVNEYEVYPRRNDDIAAVMYTSGTTGQPKGVRHTHGNLVANATALIKCVGLTRKTVGLTVCQCFHVVGLNVTTTPLIRVMAENRLLPEWDPETVLTTIEDHSVTYTFFTPSMIIDLLDYDDVDRYDLSSLSVVGVGGAPMPKQRFDDAERVLGCPVLEGYGMTETTPLAAFNQLRSNTRKRGSVGPPAKEVIDLRIEDPETGALVDQGEKGELLWHGDTVTPGYERQRNNTDAFVERAGVRWLRSGDIGWRDDDGNLYIVDRREDMFTTGCANVYPRVIEDVLYELDHVSEAAIIDARDDLRGAIVTAIIMRSRETLTGEQVRAVCEEYLEPHEIPQRVEFVDKIPKTATGKTDRIALREAFGTTNS
ncbi:class I adenylate-forming enzyme family protein [Halocatena marina]|uniref:Class I adenylate-forming enzyme family protein n=1 Tax=Halocatena marina TaxID=2934937 RepID=A0ABD5YPU5_9EURY|nr:class I adenylate-forming enzyme family protein [Halocatena marina]